MAIRAAMHQMGGVLLEKLLNSDGGGYQGAHLFASADYGFGKDSSQNRIFHRWQCGGNLMAALSEVASAFDL